jgi:hypothetical protein
VDSDNTIVHGSSTGTSVPRLWSQPLLIQSPFRSGRNFSAWIGIVPKQHSSGGKHRLGNISKQGDRYLRGLLAAGALAVIRYAKIIRTRRPSFTVKGVHAPPWAQPFCAAWASTRCACLRNPGLATAITSPVQPSQYSTSTSTRSQARSKAWKHRSKPDRRNQRAESGQAVREGLQRRVELGEHAYT